MTMSLTIKIGSFLIAALSLAGCVIRIEQVPQVDCKSTWPDFPETTKPKLHVIAKEELKCLEPYIVNRLLENDQNLKNYVKKLEIQIKTYKDLKNK